MESTIVLEVKNLTKIYPKSSSGVENASFQVLSKQIHAFIGENGAGKTTTIKCIVDAYQNYEGSITINGFSNKTPEGKKFIGYVPEHSIFPREITSYEFLYEMSLLSGLPSNIIKERIDYYFKILDIENLANLKPYNFSSGQKRKIMLIQSLIHNPSLIILDEPFSNLDPSSRFEFLNIIKLLRDEGKSVFLSTHNLSEVDDIIDSLTLINKGKIYYCGKKEDNLNKMYSNYILNLNVEEHSNE
ncbi:ABC transporter ATP-binding protein [Mesomycoplasma conjunctivae]|uniref:ABC transporter ATP-binding protein n=1 Tax=Mesomycoplasma conjunctivae TaxID=45361 RepID=UPI003DA5D065